MNVEVVPGKYIVAVSGGVDSVVLLHLLHARPDVELVVASDLDVTLLGFKGTSALYAEQKGATPEQAQELDLAISDFARSALEVTGTPPAPDWSPIRAPVPPAAWGSGCSFSAVVGSRGPPWSPPRWTCPDGWRRLRW